MTPGPHIPLVSTRLAGCLPLARALVVLREAIRSRAAGALPRGVIERIEIEIEPTAVLHWLAAQAPGQRWFFRSREGTLTTAGVGCALSFATLADAAESGLLAKAAPAPHTPAPSLRWATAPTFYCASHFDPLARGKHAPEWAGFERSLVVLPIIEVRRTDETILAVHVTTDVSQALSALEQCEPPVEQLHLPRGLRQTSDGDPVRWADGIDAALGAIASGSIEKVVLARTRGYCAIESIDPCGVLFGLIEEEPIAFHFLIEQSEGSAFLGASPERLFRRTGDLIESEAVAGTCGRGPDGASDDRLAGRLLNSDKNRREHEIVIRRIDSVLAPMVERLVCDESPRVMRLRHVQHLMTTTSGRLLDGVDDARVVSELHPTPAVCGWPVESSREFIRQHERMGRGLYAGVVGVTSADSSDFSVAIRSALICRSEMTAYSGAGIVRGSDSDAEWLETERKLSAFEALVARAVNSRSQQEDVARTGSQHAAREMALPRLVAGP
ncbi:MAG: isochorismate synthase [Phycisphaerales bacterium]|nr:isochorismate synthase [Phycisphaerales bacterium]